MTAGGVQAGSMTAAVLEVLASRPQKFWACYEVRACAADTRALDWALWRVVQMGWAETGDDARNELWQRYRITRAGLQKIGRAQQ